MKNKEKITFGNPLYFKEPRFLSFFLLIVLSVLFAIYIVEQIIDPNGAFFIQISFLVGGVYLSLVALRIKNMFML